MVLFEDFVSLLNTDLRYVKNPATDFFCLILKLFISYPSMSSFYIVYLNLKAEAFI